VSAGESVVFSAACTANGMARTDSRSCCAPKKLAILRAIWPPRPEAASGKRVEQSASGRGSPPSFRKSNSIACEEEPAMQLTEKHREYWRRNLTITAILLFIWFVVTFVIGYYARELSFNFFGWPFAFWMGAQGALIIYVILIWYYARYMNNLDRVYDVHEGDEE
jgi:putative solute:sodium symporter small subunit